MDCHHLGTIWEINVTDNAAPSAAAGFECTRCGARWEEDPRDVTPATPGQ